MSWLLFPLEDWFICCMNPPGFEGTWLWNSLSSIPVIMYGQLTWTWKPLENIPLVHYPTCIKIDFLYAGNCVTCTRDHGLRYEIIFQETHYWQVWFHSPFFFIKIISGCITKKKCTNFLQNVKTSWRMWAGLVVEPIKTWGVAEQGTSIPFSWAKTYASQLHNSTST